MTRIKILGFLIFALSIALTFLSYSLSQENKINTTMLNTINEQKAFTQEISKNIFYIYTHKNASPKQLNASIKMFLSNLNNKNELLSHIDSEEIQKQSDAIIVLWNIFYKRVQDFKDQSKVTSAYSNIILEETVKDIYNTNLKLIYEFEKMIQLHKMYFTQTQETYKYIQFILFFTLVALLIYLFTQLKELLLFIQKFLDTSKKIITNSTIKDLVPISCKHHNNQEIMQAANNFNLLVEKINQSVKYSSEVLEHSYYSLELVEQNIEDLITLLNAMNEDEELDNTVDKQEDTVIQSLEELTSAILNLKNLKKDLDNLISHNSVK
ncbi:MAG TPA: hypothetical protein CFH84_04370 [Sulfurimonas sp. UBA12504]|nr:MAG: hypothetical protein A2019_09835 [Sulfurimonas sp. GWF2_37_8]DAB30376.1 MAG TPA: hypothetical protein CFH84_04370 [Sulfurimonas sp. UBA12504]